MQPPRQKNTWWGGEAEIYRTLAQSLPDVALAQVDAEMRLSQAHGTAELHTSLAADRVENTIIWDAFPISKLQRRKAEECWQAGIAHTLKTTLDATPFLITLVPLENTTSKQQGLAVIHKVSKLESNGQPTADLLAQWLAITEMGQAVTASFDVETILQRVLHTVRPLFQAEAVTISLKQGNNLVVVANDSSVPLDIVGKHMPADSGISGQVLRTRKAVLYKGQEVRRRINAEAEQAVGYYVQVMIVAPLILDEEAVGVIAAVQSDEHALTETDLRILEAAASWAAIALGNAMLYTEVKSVQEQLSALTTRLALAQEEERRRVARELHDEAGQVLTALKISLNLVELDIPPELSYLRHRLEQVGKLADEAMERIRQVAYTLRPPELDVMGLDGALEDLCEEFGRHTQLRLSYAADETLPELPEDVCVTLYRFVQEALTNIAKHAYATSANVRLTHDSEAEFVCVTVEDNGRGIATAAAEPSSVSSPGLGLLGMRERFRSLSGWLQIDSSTGSGLSLKATVPYGKRL